MCDSEPTHFVFFLDVNIEEFKEDFKKNYLQINYQYLLVLTKIFIGPNNIKF